MVMTGGDNTLRGMLADGGGGVGVGCGDLEILVGNGHKKKDLRRIHNWSMKEY